MADMKTFVDKVADGRFLSEAEAAQAFDIIMSGDASDVQIGAFLLAIRVRGETVEEITGAARTMRAKVTGVQAPNDSIDIVGTGGDAKGTFNISTCTALVAAGAGALVAKHGSKAVSSKSGASDVLEALGVKLGIAPYLVTKCINEANVGFMFAPAHHSAMKHVMPARAELATRTIFNLLGPLTNPAGVKSQLMGVYAKDWVEPLANVLKHLGSDHVWVVHGSDGMDELTTTGISYVCELKNSVVSSFTISPADAGLAEANPEDLIGGDAAHNAKAIREVLDSTAGPFRDVVVLNAAAALIVAGKAQNIKEGATLATQSIDSGAAKSALDKLIAISNS
ncbi:MAG: anthranilate phosphoribosyltransferase [bacterium]|nr:anthranilate phosphoribosyltransferase [bacterium]